MGLDREFLILITAGILALLVIGVAGVDHFVIGAILVAIIIALALLLALARFGPDRVPLEVYLKRRWRYARAPRRYTYVQPSPRQPAMPPPDPTPATPSSPPSPQPVTWQWQDAGAAYGLAAALVLIAGGYFLVWMGRGGADELAALWRFLLFAR